MLANPPVGGVGVFADSADGYSALARHPELDSGSSEMSMHDMLIAYFFARPKKQAILNQVAGQASKTPLPKASTVAVGTTISTTASALPDIKT